jgi:hypothetical protein
MIVSGCRIFPGWGHRFRNASRPLVLAAIVCQPLLAHDGPPFPIVNGRRDGAYEIAVWTDPDATDDGSAGGQFWVMLKAGDGARAGEIPAGTVVDVSIRPSGSTAEWQRRRAEPVEGKLTNQFAALVMDHEGRFDVHVEIAGPLGPAAVAAWVDATYDLRPPPAMLVVYLMPFLAIGVLWLKLLLRRRGGAPGRSRSAGPSDQPGRAHRTAHTRIP